MVNNPLSLNLSLTASAMVSLSVSTNTVRELRQVLSTELKPRGNIDLILRDIKQGIRYQHKVCQKDLLEQCIRGRVFPKEILALAQRVRGVGNEDRDRREEIRITRIRLQEKKSK